MAALDAGFGGEENIVLPALPGISGFEVAICPASRNCLNARLLEQADDPSWARPMEAGIFGELSRLPGGVGQAHVVCRQTICGILLPLSPGAIRPDRTPFIGRLQTEFGFSPYYNTADSADLQAIYLTTVLPSWWPVTESDD